ncbi:MAG: transposase, partial [Thermoplasmatales archaeon]|nr:transposase [Thermoplasmatales archaeon]
MVHYELVKNAFLPRHEDCFDYLQKVRWKGTVRCPYCCSSDIWSDGFTLKGSNKYQCQRCYQYFNDLTGTVFDNHKFPLEEMFYIIKEMEASNGSKSCSISGL